jgi:hypothetical protein
MKEMFPVHEQLRSETDRAKYVERLLREVYEDLGEPGEGVDKQTWSSVRNLAALYWNANETHQER